MSDDFLADYRRELHVAAQRRAMPRPSGRWNTLGGRGLRAALAAAVIVAAAVAVLSLAGPAEQELEAPVGSSPPGTTDPSGQSDDCAPSAAMRRAVPVLDYPAPEGGVPLAVRTSRGTRDSAVVGQYARQWGSQDGVAYWVVPWLACDDRDLEADRVCVYPVYESELDNVGGGGAACGEVGEIEAAPLWIHFPLRDGGGAGIAGFAPRGASAAFVRIARDGFQDRFEVRDGVWGGTLEGFALRGEVGSAEVTFNGWQPSPVAVLNGSGEPRAAERVTEELTSLGYRRVSPAVGNWSPNNLRRSTIYYEPGKRWLGDRIATFLSGRHQVPTPEIAEMTQAVRDLGGEEADAIVVVGEDLTGMSGS